MPLLSTGRQDKWRCSNNPSGSRKYWSLSLAENLTILGIKPVTRLLIIGIEEIKKEFFFEDIIDLDSIYFTEEDALKMGKILFDNPIAEIVSESR